VPDHEIATEKEVERLMKKYHVQGWQLPKIHIDDPAIADLDAIPGDVIKIIRKSPTAGVFITYRYVIDPSLRQEARILSNSIFLGRLSEEETIKKEDEKKIAREIIAALKQATPPVRGLRRITVGREGSIREFGYFFDEVSKKDGRRGRFVIGEIGQGKSHFLFLLRDEAFRHNLAVSIVETSLLGLKRFYNRVLENVCFPENPIDLGNLNFLFWKLIIRIRNLAEKEIKTRNFDPLNYPRLVLVMRKIVEKLKEDFGNIDMTYAEAIESAFQSILKEGEIQNGTLVRSTRGVEFNDSLRAFVELIKACGFNGLVILVDEAEIDRSRISYDNIKNLFHIGIPGLLVVCAGTQDLLFDPNKGIKTLDYDLYTYIEKNKTELEILSEEDYETLMERVIAIYDLAHATKLCKDVTSQVKRNYLDRVLESKAVEQLTPRLFLTRLITWLVSIHKKK